MKPIQKDNRRFFDISSQFNRDFNEDNDSQSVILSGRGQRVTAVDASTKKLKKSDVSFTKCLTEFKAVASGIRNGTQTENIPKAQAGQCVLQRRGRVT